uniref:Uncharacterized protein n=1 Tax=Physcomitrium patens TaxID=3218 RepID=A0A7I4A968_PHYPA
MKNPAQIVLVDTKTKKFKEILETLPFAKVKVTTQRGVVPVGERMQGLDGEGTNRYACASIEHRMISVDSEDYFRRIPSDANGYIMLALAPSAQSIPGIIQHISVHLSDQFCYFEVGCSYWFDDCDQMLNSRFLGEAIF